MVVFDLEGDGVEAVEAADICGVAAASGGFACTTGEGRFLAAAGGSERLHPGLAFDNHLVRIAA